MEKNTEKIREFIIREVERHPADIALHVANSFYISRQKAHKFVSREVQKGTLIKVGGTRWTRYFLSGGKHIEFALQIKKDLAEDRVWSQYIRPLVLRCPDNIQKICAYGFTEILNNVIDHSEGTRVFVELSIKDAELSITILDNGVGIFQKIQNALNLESVREAILHLSKGKFTTDPSKHTGEGIFFTSRMFNSFSIFSNNVYYTFKNKDWFLSSEKAEDFGRGTFIKMVLDVNTKRTSRDIFEQYSDQEIGFGKTYVAVSLSADPNDPHISRSQAKRLLIGLDKFKYVILDFKGIESIGQAFVDEVFRVYKNEHPSIDIQYINANQEVDSMIRRGLANRP
ncbi:MAG: DUF4325 domain-containing protein [bacterium]|nr:DUF4325 domain-containing protein [bacterium]